MPISDSLLYNLCKLFPSPVAERMHRFGGDPASDEYGMAYATDQFDRCIRGGIGIVIRDKVILEIGCGHGGVTCFCGVNGARRAIGLDLDEARLAFAGRFAERLKETMHLTELPVEWLCASATNTGLPDASVDIVHAPNVFEHFVEPDKVMQEAYRILRPGGVLHIPIFSSIYSRWGIHMKHCITLPNANVFFSEPTICRVARRMAKEQPELNDIYLGLATANRVRDARKHGDLNDLTYKKFKKMAASIGFRVEGFRSAGSRVGRLVSSVPGLRETLLVDVFSTGAAANLIKPQ